VYEFVVGDGEEFDYGYDFLECAAQKFYHAQDADKFTPFYCFLDYPKSKMGLSRTMTLAEGHAKCNHRFKEGRKTEFGWPPPFLKKYLFKDRVLANLGSQRTAASPLQDMRAAPAKSWVSLQVLPESAAGEICYWAACD
jgi:hypothetical protein